MQTVTQKTEITNQFFRAYKKAVGFFGTTNISVTFDFYPRAIATPSIEKRIKDIEKQRDSLKRRMLKLDSASLDEINSNFDNRMKNWFEISENIQNKISSAMNELKQLQENIEEQKKNIEIFSDMSHNVKRDYALRSRYKTEQMKTHIIKYENKLREKIGDKIVKIHRSDNLHASEAISGEDIVVLNGEPLSARSCVNVSLLICALVGMGKYKEANDLGVAFSKSMNIAYHRVILGMVLKSMNKYS